MTDKTSVQALVLICKRMGVENVVISPGSRNAPLINGFSSDDFKLTHVPDERVAGYFALGQALATGSPTVLCCTSGTAGLNYAPAIAEAYYQGVPLLICTADRPSEWIDMGIGQSIRQSDMYDNYVKNSFQLIQEASTDQDLWHNERQICEAINLTKALPQGPVHVNLPFRESLYGKSDEYKLRHPITRQVQAIPALADQTLDELLMLWQGAKRKMILIGQQYDGSALAAPLQRMIDEGDVIVLSETTSNLSLSHSIDNIDRVLPLVDEQGRPDLVISIGDAIVSKRIKRYLKDAKPEYHWWLGQNTPRNTFQRLSHVIPVSAADFLENLSKTTSPNDNRFQSTWDKADASAKSLHEVYLSQLTSFCDIKVFEFLLANMPDNAVLHLANSTPIRYSQLFKKSDGIKYLSNRGVSGIDGSTSTALGFASRTPNHNVLITGDISFYYDSNAFWLNLLPTNLTIVLINNGGGDIFRYIPGPDTTDNEEAFTTPHNMDAVHICKLYGITHTKVSDAKGLQDVWSEWQTSQGEKLRLLEVDTSKYTNAHILRDYFSYLSNG